MMSQMELFSCIKLYTRKRDKIKVRDFMKNLYFLIWIVFLIVFLIYTDLTVCFPNFKFFKLTVAIPFLLVLEEYVFPLILKVIFLFLIAFPLLLFKVALNLIILAFLTLIFLAFKTCFTITLLTTFSPLYSVIIL